MQPDAEAEADAVAERAWRRSGPMRHVSVNIQVGL